MSPELISILELGVIFVIATVLPVNIGVLAFVAAFLVGTLIGDQSPTTSSLGSRATCAFHGIVTGYCRELWLWVMGERTWAQSAGGLLGRVQRRLPAPPAHSTVAIWAGAAGRWKAGPSVAAASITSPLGSERSRSCQQSAGNQGSGDLEKHRVASGRQRC
jgi:hypothetical protein